MSLGTLFIVSAPAGTGKTTLVEKLVEELPHAVRSISYTTRPPRAGEKDGRDYHFVSFQEFHRKIEKGEFLEYAEVFGHFYGTAKKCVDSLLNKNLDTVLVIDTQGALALKKSCKGVYIFLSPPSIEELKERLQKRNTESLKELELRLSWAKQEINKANHYDYHLINQDLDETYQALKSIFVAERLKKQSKMINHEDIS